MTYNFDSMQYYKLEHSTNPEEIGIFDQVQSFMQPYDYWGPKSFVHIPLEGEIKSEVIFPKFIMEAHAKKTDLLTIVPLSGNLLVISPKMFDLMKEFGMDAYQSYIIEVIQGSESLQYHVIYFIKPRDKDYVNWESTVLSHTTQFGQNLIKEIQFSDYESFHTFKKSLTAKKEALRVRKLMLKTELIEKGIFRLLFISKGIYISEALKKMLQGNGITGCRYIALKDLNEPVLAETYPHMFDSKENST